MTRASQLGLSHDSGNSNWSNYSSQLTNHKSTTPVSIVVNSPPVSLTDCLAFFSVGVQALKYRETYALFDP